MSVTTLEKRFYLSRPGWQDGSTEFHDLVRSLVENDGGFLLEIGAGGENRTSTLLASLSSHLDGLDIDERILTNPAHSNPRVYDGSSFPFEDEAYDVIVADYVMEHVQLPEAMLKEVRRVLRPGGSFVFRTPNLYHYVTLTALLTPHTLHLQVANRARRHEAGAPEPDPTFYRFNSVAKVRSLAQEAGLELRTLRLVEKQPSYLRFHPLAYRCGVLYERAVNSTPALARLRANIFGVLRRQRGRLGRERPQLGG